MVQKKKAKKHLALSRRKLVIASFVVAFTLLLGSGVFINARQAHNARQREQVELSRLTAEQKAKANQTAKIHTLPQPKGEDVVDQHFTDTSETVRNSSACARLQNRPGMFVMDSSCRYSLRAKGKLTMAVVFVYDNSPTIYPNFTDGNSKNVDSLAYINTYLAQQAARYKVKDVPSIEMTFFGSYKNVQPVYQLYYRDSYNEILDTYKKTATANKVPFDKYDMVHYVSTDYAYGGAASPWTHQAFTLSGSSVGTFIHETLHLLGASDKYNNNDCATIGQGDPFGRYNGSQPGLDIMCSSYSYVSSNINDITAREIGWEN